MKTFIIILLFSLSVTALSQDRVYKVGKTTCKVSISTDDKTGYCTWENGKVTTLKLVGGHMGDRFYSEYYEDKYTGQFYFNNDLGLATYKSDCDECNGKEYKLKIIY